MTTQNHIKTAAELGLGIANILMPGSGTAIQLGRHAIQGIIAIYDQIMASRPNGVTEEEWRQILTQPLHQPGFVSQILNEERERQAKSDKAP